MQRLLVTGASGLLGSRIIEHARGNFEAVPLHGAKPLHPNSLKIDITNQNSIPKLFNKLKPHTVIHTASETNVDKCEIEKEHAWKVNAEGTRNIAIACGKTNTRLVYISTNYVFNGEKGNYTEEDKPLPINYYGLTKLEGEKQVIEHSKNYAIMRTSVLYGWHPWKQNFATWIINKLKQQRTHLRNLNFGKLPLNLFGVKLQLICYWKTWFVYACFSLVLYNQCYLERARMFV